MNISRAVHPPPGRDDAAHDRHRARRHASAFRLLPVSPLPQVDFPTISVSGVAARREPRDDGVDRRDAARARARPHRRRHRDHLVELARHRRASRCSSISTATSTAPRATCRPRSTPRAALLPTNLPSNPTYRKVNPADAPIMILALTSDTMTQGQMYDAASTDPRAEARAGGGRRARSASAAARCRRCASSSIRRRCNKYGHRRRGRAHRASPTTNVNRPEGRRRGRRPALADRRQRPGEDGRRIHAADRRVPQRRRGAPVATSPRSSTRCRTCATPARPTASRRCCVIVCRQPGANIIETVDRVHGAAAAAARVDPGAIDLTSCIDRTPTIRASLQRRRAHAGDLDRRW